jgi:outer membrane protein
MQKMMAAIDKHARANSFSVVLDISSQQSPVLYATNEINITNDVIAIYDQDNPVAGSLLSE